VIGHPDQDATRWDGQQTFSDDCAIRAQQFIIELYSGQKLDEQALVADAYGHGWYHPGSGTSLQDMDKELIEHGIPANMYEHANVSELANELAQGHRVIIAVDSSELWHGTPTGAADHAVVVSGIDTSDPSNPQVIVSDPGVPNGAEDRYPLAQFIQAWQGSDFYMVATDQPAPQGTPGMQNFDYSTGHIDQIAGVPYDQFQSLAGQPDRVNQVFEQASGGAAPTPQEIFHDANPSLYPAEPFTAQPEDGFFGAETHADPGVMPTDLSSAEHLGSGLDMQSVAPHWPQSDDGTHTRAMDSHGDMGEPHDLGHDMDTAQHTTGEPFDPGM